MSVMKRSDPKVIWACGFGSGWLPRAPGTWGSLLALVCWWVWLSDLAWVWQLLVVAVYFGVSCVVISKIERQYQVHDASEIVADEFAGLWLALVAAPATLWVALLGFAAFRLFDIAKPWPVGWLDRQVGGGLGVMLDDIAAGAMAWGVVQLSLLLFQAVQG